MRRSQVVANEALTIISRPLVTKFIQYSSSLTPHATQDLIQRICVLTNNAPPVTWRLVVDHGSAPAIVRFLQANGSLTVADVCSHDKIPRCESIPLLLLRGGMSHLLPSDEMPLQENDELLLCGHRNSVLLAQRLRDNAELVDSLINGNQHEIPLLRWLSRRNSN